MIYLHHRYSKLDKRHQFSLTADHIDNAYFQWVWFYLGHEMKGSNNGQLLPYTIKWNTDERQNSKLLKSYKSTHHAKEIAKWIYLAMTKKLRNYKV